MGNISSSGGEGRRRRRRHHTAAPPPPPPPPSSSLPPPPPATEIQANPIVFAAVTPYPNPNPNPNPVYQYPASYIHHPPPGTMSGPPLPPYDHHLHHPYHNHSWAPVAMARYSYAGHMMAPPTPYVEHQKAVTIRNDVNLKKETLRLEPDPDNPGRFLVSFTFDATVSGR